MFSGRLTEGGFSGFQNFMKFTLDRNVALVESSLVEDVEVAFAFGVIFALYSAMRNRLDLCVCSRSCIVRYLVQGSLFVSRTVRAEREFVTTGYSRYSGLADAADAPRFYE